VRVTDRLVGFGFVAAAAFNIVGILVVSEGLTNQVMFGVDPLFSLGGCLGVIVWGLLYLAQGRSWRQAPAVSAVLAVEKLFYASWWAWWMSANASTLPELAVRSPSAAAFYGSYGAGDALFAVFFALVAARAARSGP
jgi:hypothetical protein